MLMPLCIFVNITFEDLISAIITLFGVAIAIWQFKVQLSKNRVQSIRNQRVSWYQNVVVIPQLVKIDKLYDALILRYENFHQYREPNRSVIDLLRLQVKITRDCKDLISSFANNLECMVRSYDGYLCDKVISITSDLEDIISLNLFGTIEYNPLYKQIIMDNKADLIQALTEEIKE